MAMFCESILCAYRQTKRSRETALTVRQGLRYHALDRTDDARLLHITFTVRASGTSIRVISARDMHRKEGTFYGQAKENAT